MTAAPTVFHSEHGADQDCTVCKLRNQLLADLSGELQVRPTEANETLAQTPRITLVLSYPGARLPGASALGLPCVTSSTSSRRFSDVGRLNPRVLGTRVLVEAFEREDSGLRGRYEEAAPKIADLFEQHFTPRKV